MQPFCKKWYINSTVYTVSYSLYSVDGQLQYNYQKFEHFNYICKQKGQVSVQCTGMYNM